METTATTIVEPKVFKTHDPQYFSKYYREHYSVKVHCPHCNKQLTKGKLTRHINTNNACLLLRAQAELEAIKGKPKEEVPEPPEHPPLDVKWMVSPRIARKI
jgi:hypothetical protein